MEEKAETAAEAKKATGWRLWEVMGDREVGWWLSTRT